MRRRWPLLVLVLAPLIALWPGLTGLAVGPFDQIRQMAPWNGPKVAAPWDVLMADSVLQSHVWRTLVLDAWGKGQLPLWNPYEFAGTPLLANSQSGGFYPPHIVLGLLHVPAGFAGFLLAWFHLALAGIGTYALVRRLGGSAAGGLTAAFSFGLSPFLLGWTPLSSPLATIAWLPLALACVVDVTDRRSLVALAACIGMILLAGHLQFAAYGLGAIALFSIFRRMVAGATYRSGVAVGLALILGMALAAPQLLPVLNYSKESHRRNVPTEEGYQAFVGSALRPFELATLAHPMALGSPRESVDVGGRTIAAYWPPLVKGGANFAESAVGVGAVVFALLFAVPWRRRETWPLAAVGALALLLALGTPLNRLLYSFVPGWSSTGSPGRVEVLFVLTGCALAGLAVDGLAERGAQIRAAVGAVVGMLLALVLPSLAATDGPGAALRGAATAGAMLPVLGATVAAILAFFAAKRSAWAVPAGAALVACLTHALILVPFGRPLDPPKGDPNVRIAVVNDSWDLYSVPHAVLPPNLAALGRLHELSGYDSLTSLDAVEMLRTVSGVDPTPPENGNMMLVKSSADPKALAENGVTEVWSRKPLPPLGTPREREGYWVYSIAGPGRVTGGRVVDGYDRQTVLPDGTRSTVTIRDRASLGWPRVAGSSGRWREVDVAGASPVTVRYSPPGLSAGMAVGVGAWLVPHGDDARERPSCQQDRYGLAVFVEGGDLRQMIGGQGYLFPGRHGRTEKQIHVSDPAGYALAADCRSFGGRRHRHAVGFRLRLDCEREGMA